MMMDSGGDGVNRMTGFTLDSPVEPLLPRVRKGNAVYHAVKRAILLHDVEPGTAIVEQSIAQRMGCSQGTVREALLRLSQDGLVERRGYKGTIVSAASVEEVAQMARIRIDLESMGIKLAATRFRAKDGDRLRGILEELELASASRDDYARSELDRLFHQSIFRLSDLPALEPILDRCALFMHRFTFGKSDDENRAPYPFTSSEHAELLDRLEARDPEGAARVGVLHIKRVIRRWAPVLDRALDSLDRERSDFDDRAAEPSE